MPPKSVDDDEWGNSDQALLHLSSYLSKIISMYSTIGMSEDISKKSTEYNEL